MFVLIPFLILFHHKYPHKKLDFIILTFASLLFSQPRVNILFNDDIESSVETTSEPTKIENWKCDVRIMIRSWNFCCFLKFQIKKKRWKRSNCSTVKVKSKKFISTIECSHDIKTLHTETFSWFFILISSVSNAKKLGVVSGWGEWEWRGSYEYQYKFTQVKPIRT